MDIGVISALLLALGIGGLIGAAAAAVLAAGRLRAAYDAFDTAFRAYMVGRTDPPSLELLAAYEAFSAEIAATSSAFERLRRALRRR